MADKQYDVDTNSTRGNLRVSTDDHLDVLAESPDSDDFVVRADKDFIVSLVLSIGIAASLVTFVFESFTHPNEATMLIPLIIGPVGTVVIRLMKRDCPKCRARLEKTADD